MSTSIVFKVATTDGRQCELWNILFYFITVALVFISGQGGLFSSGEQRDCRFKSVVAGNALKPPTRAGEIALFSICVFAMVNELNWHRSTSKYIRVSQRQPAVVDRKIMRN